MERASRQRVGLVPLSLFRHPEIGCEEQAIYGFMSTHSDRLGDLWVAVTTIAAAVKLDRGKVRRRLDKLVDLGFVERHTHPDPAIRCPLYRLVGHGQLVSVLLEGAGDEQQQTEGNPRVSRAPERVGEHEHGEHSQKESLSHGRGGAEGGVGSRETGPAIETVTVTAEWTPSDADRAYASERRSDLTPAQVQFVAEKFALAYSGRRVANPSGIFRTWIIREIVHENRRPASSAIGRPSVRDGGRSRRPADGRGSGLADRNLAAADACLRRFLERRAEHPPAS